MIRAFIVDDEPIARETLALSLRVDPEIEVIGSCSGVEAVEAIPRERPELLFIDVQMPGLSGFDVLDRIGAGTVPAIVFVTAWDKYALKAFDVAAVDYLLKPFDDARFRQTLGRVRERLAAGAKTSETKLATLLETRGQPFLARFVVRNRDESIFVPVEDVDYLEAADDYVELHVGKTTHLIRERLSELEARVDPSRFARIHRGTIVNVDRVVSLTPLFRGDSIVRLRDGVELRLARGRREGFERVLTQSPHARHRSPQAR